VVNQERERERERETRERETRERETRRGERRRREEIKNSRTQMWELGKASEKAAVGTTTPR
jgi:hypothetical protein